MPFFIIKNNHFLIFKIVSICDMKITIISVGKVKEIYFKASIDEYSKRIKNFVTLNKIEIQDEKIIDSMPENSIKIKEGEKILKSINPDSYKIAMTETGKHLTSEEFADFIKKLQDNGYQEISFIIGGALGLSDAVMKTSDFNLALSKMTLVHQMAQLFLTEQVYRSFKIINNEPYHK